MAIIVRAVRGASFPAEAHLFGQPSRLLLADAGHRRSGARRPRKSVKTEAKDSASGDPTAGVSPGGEMGGPDFARGLTAERGCDPATRPDTLLTFHVYDQGVFGVLPSGPFFIAYLQNFDA